ncbi:MAG TPA: tRNA pseudouridine(38-40) synthase TruA [Chitinispirillaceae bacterium]|nr:tRNA pseudouridine(38-40) synthase TruA [Chitinispirillaceae bacterium]
MRYFFRVEYDGSRYGGWQRQPNAVSIQELLEKAFQTALRTPVSIVGAGRTDAGVHARGQGAHLDVAQPIDIRRCELSVNALLPREIAVYNLKTVDESFHARYSAISRRYKYLMCTRKRPLNFERVWMLYYRIDWDRIRYNLQYLKGSHDFTSFCASGSDTVNNVCDVKSVSLDDENGFITFTIEANRFIYKMVRTIVGTLIEIGRDKNKSTMEDIIAAKSRILAGETAPPFGLFLENVFYPGGI